MGPKAPTATPTAPSFETPYLETILLDGAARWLFAAAVFSSRERLAHASPPRLTKAESFLPSSSLPQSVVRDDPLTKYDEVCLRNGKCGNKTNSRASSSMLEARGCRFPGLSRKRDDPSSRPLSLARSLTHTRTHVFHERVTVHPCLP